MENRHHYKENMRKSQKEHKCGLKLWKKKSQDEQIFFVCLFFRVRQKSSEWALCFYWKPQKAIHQFQSFRLVRAAQVQVMWLYLWTSHFSRAAYFKIMFILSFFLIFISKCFLWVFIFFVANVKTVAEFDCGLLLTGKTLNVAPFWHRIEKITKKILKWSKEISP